MFHIKTKRVLFCWKLPSRRKVLRQYQFLLTCFRPYIDLLSFHTSLVPSFATFAKSSGCSMNTFSLISARGKADFTSNSSRWRLCCAANAITSLNVSGRVVGANVSPKYAPSVCANPLATNLDLYFSATLC